jgi:hypothetical protein
MAGGALVYWDVFAAEHYDVLECELLQIQPLPLS